MKKFSFNNISIKELLRIGTGSRTEKAKKNIVVLFIIHFFNFLALMAIVPVTIKYLGENQYGVWLTLSSVFMWLGNLDFGIGNGLRNKLAESFAKEDFQLARKYLSTAYENLYSCQKSFSSTLTPNEPKKIYLVFKMLFFNIERFFLCLIE